MSKKVNPAAVLKAIGTLGERIATFVDVEPTGIDFVVTVYCDGSMGPRGSFKMTFHSNADLERIGEVVRAAAAAAFPD